MLPAISIIALYLTKIHYRLLSEKVEIKIYRIKILPVALYKCEV
jgi:hypothetical protein